MAESDKDLQFGFSPEQMNKMLNFWTDVMKLPTIGPMYAFSKDIGAYANDFINLGKIVGELKTDMDSYWVLVNSAYTRALKDTIEHAPKQLVSKDDFENYRRAAIEAFEYSFTALFASPEFSTVYGKLFSTQLDMSRAMQSIAEKNFKALNLPTRSEVDEILKDIVELKRSVRELRKNTEMTKNDTRSPSA